MESVGKWEVKLREQRELKKQGAAVLHQRVVLLAECYDDKEFHAWCEANGTSDLDFLDSELADVACDFLTLKAVLHEYPNVEAWQKHNVRDLIAEILDSQKKTRPVTERISWKERCIAAEKECERLRTEIQAMQKVLEYAGLKSTAS